MTLGDRLKERFAYMKANYPGFQEETVATHINIIRTADLLFRTVSRELRPHGLTPPAMGILFLLDGVKEPVSMSMISAHMIVSQANVTGLVDTLEKSGLARRLPHPEDRRVTQVEITTAGRKKVREFWPGLMELLNELYSDVSSSEKKTMLKVMEKIRKKLLPFLGALLLILTTPAHSLTRPALSLPLNVAVRTALENNPSLAAPRAIVEGASAQRLILLGAYDTSLSAAISRVDAKTPPAFFFQTPRTITDSASVGLARRFATGTSASAATSLGKEMDKVSSAFTLNPRVRSSLNLSLTQSLLKGFVGRPERAALREADFAVRAARAELERASELLAQRVITAYWGLWLSRQNEQVLIASQKEAREFLATTKKLFKRYEAEKDDLLRAQASLLSKELEVLQAKEAILEREEDLSALLASPFSGGELDTPMPPDEVPELEDSLKQALAARSDLTAKKLAAQRDKMHLDSLAGLGLPSLDLTGGLGWSGLKARNAKSMSQLGRAGFRTWSIGLNLSYAFGARTDKGERRAAASSRMLSEARTRELRIGIEREVKTALARLRLAKQRAEITRRLEDMQEEALTISRKKYKNARISSRDRLLASDTAISARGARLRAEADGAVAEADQKASVGGLLAWLGIEGDDE